MVYNWQQEDWPDFRYALGGLDDALFTFAEETGRISGMLNAMPEQLQMEAIVDSMVAEAIKTSAIEGEFFNREDVVSSIKNGLGLNKIHDPVKNKNAQGIGSLMVNVRSTFAEPLTAQQLFEWHELLMADSNNVLRGAWRTHEEPMQVISGAMGKEKVHFEAPPSDRVPAEMDGFLNWFNTSAPGGNRAIKQASVRSAIAHLYFESIHPFEDGNGRIGRAIAEKALSQGAGRPILLSLSRTIEADKNAYYSALHEASRSNEITKWITYFSEITVTAQKQAIALVDFTIKKTKFFDHFNDRLSERQLKVIKKMMEAGPEGFEGGMNATKYGSISKISKATATRDLQYLSEIKAIAVLGGGRSTRYYLNLDRIL